MKTLTAMVAGTLVALGLAGCAPGWKAIAPSGTVEVTIAGVDWSTDSQAMLAELVPRLLDRGWTQLSVDQYSVTFSHGRSRGPRPFRPPRRAPRAKLNFLIQGGATRIMVTLGSGKCVGGNLCEGLQVALNEVKTALEARRTNP
jgi:hypothetical protein